MNYLSFKDQFFELACFTTNQVYASMPDFDRNNLVRWTKKGLVIRLRQGLYTFPEYKKMSGFTFFFANRMYRPSYISLHSALAFYGLIPEAIVQITSVSALKTMQFENQFGNFIYKSMRNDLMFGYEPKLLPDNRSMLIATPEKALLDLLYLYPFYNSPEEMENLRLDENVISESININIINDYTTQFGSKELAKRVEILKKTYQL